MSISQIHAGYTADPLVYVRAEENSRAQELTESRDREAAEASSKVASTGETSSRGVDTYA
jgi:hypothetical protein